VGGVDGMVNDGGVRKGREARQGRDVGRAVRRQGAAGRGPRWRPAAVVLVQQRKKNGEEKELEEGENWRKKKEVEEIMWVRHYLLLPPKYHAMKFSLHRNHYRLLPQSLKDRRSQFPRNNFS
jgi:hypothetical protein